MRILLLKSLRHRPDIALLTILAGGYYQFLRVLRVDNCLRLISSTPSSDLQAYLLA